MNDDVVRRFLISAESDTVRKELVQFVLQGVPTLRGQAHDLTLSEVFTAYRYELQTLQRVSILKRLRQRAKARAGELVEEYLKTLAGEIEHE